MLILGIFIIIMAVLCFTLCTSLKISYGYAVFIIVFFLFLCSAIFLWRKTPETQLSEEQQEADEVSVVIENPPFESEPTPIDNESYEETDSTEETSNILESMKEVNVDEELFDVELTIPAEFAKSKTQEEADRVAAEKRYLSAALNSDGSVTLIMTKSQHRELMDEIADEIDKQLASIVCSDEYPKITSVLANDDYTSFTIATKNDKPDMNEKLYVMVLYTLGRTYSVFAGKTVDNYHVDFVSDATGEIIASSNSSEMADKNK